MKSTVVRFCSFSRLVFRVAAQAVCHSLIGVAIVGFVPVKTLGLVWPLAGALGLAMILGTWASNRVIERVPIDSFRRFVSLLLVLIAIQKIASG